jgi:hypothetical protein
VVLEPPGLDEGAANGAFVIRGRVHDASGAAVVAVQVDLAGDETATRYSNFKGEFAFRVHGGHLGLAVRGQCRAVPGEADLGDVHSDRVVDFVASGSSCVTVESVPDTPLGAAMALRQRGDRLGNLHARIWLCADDRAALGKLTQIAEEAPSARELTLSGRPAIERVQHYRSPAPDVPGPNDGSGLEVVRLTTAIAFGATVLRLEIIVTPSHDAAAGWLAAVARNAKPEAIPTLAVERAPAAPVSGCH